MPKAKRPRCPAKSRCAYLGPGERGCKSNVDARTLKHDPEKWLPVFGKDHAKTKEVERDDDSKRSHRALRLRSERDRRGFLEEGDGDAAVGGEIGVVRKHRLEVGLAGHGPGEGGRETDF